MVFKHINPFSMQLKFFIFALLCHNHASCTGQESLPLHFPKESFLTNNEHLLAADEFFAAGLYERAISLYQQILKDETNEKNRAAPQDTMSLQTVMQSRFHLAQAYFITKKYQDAVHLLQDNLNETHHLSPALETIRQHSMYLLALIDKQTKQFDDALKMMGRYLSNDSQLVQPLRKEAQFEMGLIHFLKGDMSKAALQFESLQLDPASRLAILRQLYLARIQLAQGDFSSVISKLKILSQQLNPDNDLYYELSYLLGEAYFRNHSFLEAADCFEHALPKHFPETCGWYGETLYFHGWSYLNLADAPPQNAEKRSLYFQKAEASFLKLLAHKPEEKVHLALGQYYLARAKQLQDPDAYAKAEEMLSQKDHFTSIEGQTHALLLRAEAAPSYLLRNILYKQIIHPDNANSSFYGKGWFLYALNDFEEGQALVKLGNLTTGKPLIAQSAVAFRQAFNLLKDHDKALAATALKYQALALSQSDRQNDFSAFHVVDELIQSHPDLLALLESPDEIYYLRGFFGLRLKGIQDEAKYVSLAEQSLEQAATLPNNTFGDAALNQLAAWHYHNGNYPEAEKVYLQLIQQFPDSHYLPEAWLWLAYCADKLQKQPDIAMQRRRYVFEHYPQSPAAAEAYFSLYTYRDYLQGHRDALKHLQHFAKKYPERPYLMEAYYLIGLDAKHNRKTPEGKWIRKRSLTDAIDAFQQAESLFEPLTNKGLIPSDKLDFYTNVYYRVILERAIANLAIADESQGAKQQIYLEYAEEVFKNLLAGLDMQQSDHTKRLLQSQSYQPLYEECAFCLAQTYIKRHKDVEAECLLSSMLDRYRQDKTTRGYYLSRIKYEQGKIASRQHHHLKALQCFKESEEAGNALAIHEKLDLWIEQSHCYRNLQQFDNALLILSKVANDDAISSLRLKALFLRAEIYELQERPELARKQLESLAKKGGDWALKAQEKLEKNYGY